MFAALEHLDNETKATLNPVCTGTSVLAIKFDGGVVMAADRLASYGKMARYKNVTRFLTVNDTTMVAVSGDYADFQFLKTIIEDKMCELRCHDSDAQWSPRALYSWLSCFLYYRRSKFNPLWNTYVIIGVQGEEKEPFLGCVNLKGVAYGNPYIATGMGCMLVQQTLENAFRAVEKEGRKLTREEAINLMDECLKVLFYRDCLAHAQFEVGVVSAKGVELLPPKETIGNWQVAEKVVGYA